VTAELTGLDGGTLATYLLDVAPDPRKLRREVFATMLRDLWDVDPTLVIGAEPAMTAIGELGAGEDPWLAFARLRRYGYETLQALAAIRACPRRTLRVRRELAPVRVVRRVDRRTASALLRGRFRRSWALAQSASEKLMPDWTYRKSRKRWIRRQTAPCWRCSSPVDQPFLGDL
jgi:hypothetical protein